MQTKIKWPRFLSVENIFGLILLALLITAAVVARLNNIFWDTSGNMEEETRHTMSIIDNIMFRDLYRSIQGLLHPGLDYLSRKIFWYPLLGADERSIRLVSLLYGLLAIIFNFLIISSILQKQNKISRFFAFVLAFLGTIWIVTSQIHIGASTFGRLYSMISFLSAFFAYAYFCTDIYKRKLFHWVSFLFMNTHFFALPIIGIIYLYEAWKKHSPRLLFLFSGQVILTFLINYKPLEWLLFYFPSPGTRTLSESIASAVDRFIQFYYSDISFGSLIPMLLLVLVLIDTIKNRKLRIEYIIMMPLLFFFLLYLSKKSNYPVSPNYLLVYWGFIPVILANTIANSASIIQKISSKKNKSIFLPSLYLFILFFIIALSTDASTFVQNIRNFREAKMPPRNFTRYYQGYTWAKQYANERPILILVDACYTLEAPNYYLRYSHPIHRGALLIEDAFGCFYLREKVASNIQKFMKDNPNLIVLLDSRHISCEKIQQQNQEWNKSNAAKKNILPLHLDLGNLCFQLIDKPKSYEQLLAIINSSGFRNNLP